MARSDEHGKHAFPLYPMQHAMLLHSARAPETGVYVQQLVCAVEAPLDTALLRRAMQRLVDRHEVLRSSFHPGSGDGGERRVHAAATLSVVEQDWRDADAPGVRRRLQAYLADDARRGFRIHEPPLARVAVFRLATARYRVVWSSHHALFDGHARRLLLRELIEDYAALRRGVAPRRPPPPAYGAFVERVRIDDPGPARAWWRARLAGCELPTPLGIDGPRRVVPAAAARFGLVLPARLSAALAGLAETAGVSLNNVVQAAWAVVLGRYGGREEVVFGVARAGRPRALAGAGDTVGLCMNTLPLRVRVADDMTLVAWLAALREQWRALRAVEHCPLALVHEALGVGADRALFDSVVSFERERLDDALGATRLRFDLREHPGVPLVLAATGGRRLALRLIYHRQRFCREGIASLAASLRTVLQAMARAPEASPAGLPVIGTAQRRRALRAGNRSAAPLPAERRVHRLFERQARARAHAVAVACGDRALSYAGLNARANRLARLLRARGVRAGDVVGVCLARDAELPVALLAVLKAGAAYLPLDPDDPPARRAALAGDARAALVVARGGTGAAPGVVDLDAAAAEIDAQDAGDLDTPGGAESLACIMYTSGSTGRPKGVAVRHGAIARLVLGADYVHLDASTCMLQLAPVSFDASTFELWAPLLHGGRCVVHTERVPTLTRLEEVIRSRGVNTLWLTASLFNTVVDEAPSVLAPLTRLITGGEALSPQHVRRALERFPQLALVNAYGPTENTTFSSCQRIDPAALERAESVPIGRPVAHTRAYVLDRYLEPLPAGVCGELYLAGEGLARGYLGSPGATAERFLPDPIAADGGRMYRSGDIARWRADGALEFVGRADDQIKIRGHRVEPAEIELMLAAHPGVQRAGVAVCGSGGERALVAFVVPDPAAAPAAERELRAFLRERLPPALVPSRLVTLATLPATASGKLDRAALAALPGAGAPPAPAVTAGGDAVQDCLAAIWREVLGADLGPESDFFALGGHSLHASRIAARAGAAFGVDLPAHAVFQHPSVAALAEVLRRGDAAPPAGAPAPRDAGDAPVLSPAQLRLWLHERSHPGGDLFNIALAFEIDGALDEAALARALEQLVARHEPLRTRFAAADGTPVPRVEDAGRFELAVDDLSAHAAGEREALARRLVAREAASAFDLSVSPLLRARVLRLGPRRRLLALTVHHIAADGWSVHVLLRELALLYAAARDGRPHALAPLPLRYRDYARARGRGSRRSLEYWRERMRDAPLLELPADGERQPQLGGEAGRCVRTLPAPLTDALARLAAGEGTTLFAALLALFATLLGRLSGRGEVVVGAPVAGRDEPGLEQLVGLFLNTLPLRIALDGAADVRALVRSTAGVLNEALAHQDVSFERLVEELRPPRVAGRNPLFDVTLNFIQEEWTQLALPGAECRRLEPDTVTVKFDLTLYAMRVRDGLRLRLHYRSDLFAPQRMDALMDQLEHLAAQAAADPEQPLAALSLVPPAARRRLPDPAAVLSAPAQRPITEEVAAQAARRPAAPALLWRGGALSYAQLVARADALAGALHAGGVAAGDVVAIHGARCPGTVVAMLGVMRAGGVMLNIDAALPAARRDALAREAAAAWSLAVGAAAAPAGAWRIDAHSGALRDGAAGAVPPAHPAADAPAYVFFTSGSTGAPKAVLGVHKALAHFLAWQRREFGIDDADRCALLSALSFDAVLRDVFLPLSAGGAVCVPGDEIDAGDRLLRWLRAMRTSVAHVVPSVAASWLPATGDAGALPDLRLLFFTGEPLAGALVRRWRRLLRDDATVVNFYGPTETTLVRCYYRVPHEPAHGTQPVGAAMADTQALVLDAAGRLCGIGERGSIAIRTPFRTLGYANDAQATRRRFVRNPFRNDSDDLLYLTGDVGRYRPDGLLEVLGRDDDQVKIRGVRIEPAEIAGQLLAAPAVRACAVVAKGSGDAGRLAAYVVAEPGAGADAGALRAYLRERLPAMMVPADFVFLPRLPLLPNGKVDRRALPDPPPAAPAAAAARLTPIEAYVAALWQELLDVPQVRGEDDFFALGGHSLLAAQMVARLRRDFGAEIGLADVLAAPTPRAVAQRLATAPRAAGGDASRPAPAPDSEFGLSPAQERIWFVDRLAPQAAAYNIRFAYRLRGTLNYAALEAGLAELVRRHDALRTSVRAADGVPVQRFVPAAAAPLVVERHDLSGARDGDAALRRALGELAARPFDPAAPPLMRAALFALGGDDCVLALVVHHLAADGWSTGVLVRELNALYAAHAAGRPPALAPAPGYAEYLSTLQRAGERERERAVMEYWRRRLEGADASTIVTDRARCRQPELRGARIEARWPARTAAAVNALARRTATTPFMVLLAAFKALLLRYTQQPDVCIGTPEAARARPGLENLVGLCANTLVLRTRLDPADGFAAALARVRETVLEAFAHADAPFERVVAALDPMREAGDSPLFRILFQYQHGPLRPALELPGVSVEPVLVDNGSAKRDLSVFVQEQDDALRVVAEYDAALFERSTVQRLLGRYAALLSAAVGDPLRPLRSLPLAGDDERRRTLVEWSGGRPPAAAAQCVHEAFAEVARRRPAAPAVVCGAARLSYAELDARAERLAGALRARGVRVEARVGVCMERGAELIVALLAVLKAGGAYVPLDPELPQARLAAMAAAAGLALVLADAAEAARGRAWPAPLLCVEDAPARPADPPPPAAALPASLAYVMYTSGSSGAAKAVTVEHRQVVAYCRAAAARLGFAPGERHALVQPSAVDSSVTALWGALLSGGELHVFSRDECLDARALDTRLAHIDVLKIAPSHLRALCSAAPDLALLPRRRLVLGGEALPREWCGALAGRARGRCALFNHYGPTETAVGVLAGRADTGGGRSTVPLGRPLDGSLVYVLDRELEPVPVDVPGEIYIGGAQVARGYLDAARTAERFLPDPFAAVAGARMYRTGDRGRWLAGGVVEFLGREDAQVKILGYRVDPADVEEALRALPQVDAAAVVSARNGDGGMRLLAYVTPAAPWRAVGAEALESAVHEALNERLPRHMVPAVVALDRLPLTPHGKLDRRRLPGPRADSGHARAAPRDAREAALLEIWRDVLGVAEAGVDEDFFALGGHSLLGARLVARVNERFGAALGMRAIFDARTIAAQAALLARAQPSPAAAREGRAPADGPAPLSFGQLRLWFLDQLAPGLPSYNIGVVLRLRGRLNAAALEAALREIVRRHEVLRTTFRLLDGEPVQVVTPEPQAVLRLERMDLPQRAGADAASAALDAASGFVQRPFDLRSDLMLRALLVRERADRHVLCCALHHIASDGWSRRILYRELEALYTAFDSGLPPPLAPLALQYRDYARGQRERADDAESGRQLAYWRRALAGLPALDLPTDRARPAVQSYDGARIDFDIPPAARAGIEALAHAEQATPFMAYLAAYQAVLARRSGQRDFAVGAPVANRPRAAHEALIGLFVNTLPLRADLGGDPCFRVLLRRARDTVVAAFEHQDVPFERIVAELAPLRQLGRPPLVQALLTMQTFPRTQFNLPDCEVEVEYAHTRTVTFELSLILYARGDSLRAALLYNTALFERQTAAALASDFRALLEAAAARPDLPWRDLLPAAAIGGGRPAAARGAAAIPDVQDAKLLPAHTVAAHPPPAGRDDGEGAAQAAVVAEAWREILGCRGPDAADDFFDLGGHSLAAVRLVNRLASSLGVDIPVRLLFEHPRFERFAREVAALARGAGAPRAGPAGRRARSDAGGRLILEQTALLPLLAGGRLPRVDAAALGYYSNDSLRHCRGGRDAFLDAWGGQVPVVARVSDTPLGRTAVIRLPWLTSELYGDQAALVQSVLEGLRLAAAIGARVVSLTGLIPSATGYGRAVVAAAHGQSGLPRVTTGHATTAATVVLSVRRLLAAAGRALQNEHVGVLGLGSIGATSLRLMLERLPHPAALTLCDLYERRAAVGQLAERLRGECGYRGAIRIRASRAAVPDAMYDASVIVGATNVPGVLDVSRLRPGTVIVDDSGPHCFDVQAAIARFEARHDIMFSEGGVLRSAQPMTHVCYRPPALESIMSDDYLESLRGFDTDAITGCVVAALLGARYAGFGTEIGEVAPQAAAAHFERLQASGFDAAPPRCGAYALDAQGVERFRQRFSGTAPAAAATGEGLPN